MLATEYVINQMSALLPIYSNEYDDKLTILVPAAMNKLKNEGVPNVFTEGTTEAFDYVLCVSYQVSMDMDLGVDYNRIVEQYITRVNTLRTYYEYSNNS